MVPLPKDIEACHKILIEQYHLMQKQNEKIEALEAYVLKLAKAQYGRKSDLLDPAQLKLFQAQMEAPVQVSKVFISGEQQADTAVKTNVGHASRQFSKELLRKPTTHTIGEDKIDCPNCNCQRQVIGEKVEQTLEYEPSSVFVKEDVRLVYACPKCKGNVIEAQKPTPAIARCMAGAGMLAYIITSKYSEHLPLYRLEQILARNNAKISRSTLCEWLCQSATTLIRLYELMKDRVKSSEVIHTDDTTLPVIDKQLHKARNARVWVYNGDKKNPYNVFDYTESRKRDGPQKFLDGYKGYLQADAFTGYDCVYADGNVIEVACWAHARRKFVDASRSFPQVALPVVAMIKSLYEIEEKISKLDARQKQKTRQQESLPILQAIGTLLEEQQNKLRPKSEIAKAVNYAINNWQALKRYVDNGNLSIDNNLAERSMRPVATGRKNFLFVGNNHAGKTAAILYTMVDSAKRNGLDPWLYLKDVFSRINDLPTSQLSDLLPDNWHSLTGK